MTDDAGKILILDDDAEIRVLLATYLGARGYTVRQALDAPQLDRLIARENFDLLILDVMMPGEDGLSICKRLRLAGETIPILMLTARGDTIDRIVGLELGADDYLGKPFEPRELLARMQALLRRQHLLGAHTQKHMEHRVTFGAFSLNQTRRTLTRNGQILPLSSTEYELLKALAANAGRPLSRDRLLNLIHGRESPFTERSIDVQIMRLRRLIESDPAHPQYIQTVRGKGYVLNACTIHHDSTA